MNTPYLEVSGGTERLVLREGLWSVGRDDTADLRLTHQGISGWHAWIRRSGATTWVCDAGSTNGTWCNDRRLTPQVEVELHDGDELSLGPMTIVYHEARAGTQIWHRDAAPSGGVNFHGQVSGRTVNVTGHGGIENNYDQRRQYKFSTPEGQAIEALATGRGIGRAVMVLGLVMCVAGFGIWTAVILRFATAVDGVVSSGVPPVDTSMPSLLGEPVFGEVPAGAVGFALCGFGIVVTVIGLVMVKSAQAKLRSRRPLNEEW